MKTKKREPTRRKLLFEKLKVSYNGRQLLAQPSTRGHSVSSVWVLPVPSLGLPGRRDLPPGSRIGP